MADFDRERTHQKNTYKHNTRANHATNQEKQHITSSQGKTKYTKKQSEKKQRQIKSQTQPIKARRTSTSKLLYKKQGTTKNQINSTINI